MPSRIIQTEASVSEEKYESGLRPRFLNEYIGQKAIRETLKVGIQALLNVVQGERYVTIPDENLMFLAGWYGKPPGTVDPELLDRAFSTDRGRQVRDSGPAQPDLKDIRAQYGENLSDEELWKWAEAEARKQPGFKPVDEWRAEMARRMNA